MKQHFDEHGVTAQLTRARFENLPALNRRFLRAAQRPCPACGGLESAHRAQRHTRSEALCPSVLSSSKQGQ